nr:MAG TPA: hypothetical protein [Caudoviricetes sp.]
MIFKNIYLFLCLLISYTTDILQILHCKSRLNLIRRLIFMLII